MFINGECNPALLSATGRYGIRCRNWTEENKTIQMKPDIEKDHNLIVIGNTVYGRNRYFKPSGRH